MLTLAHISDLHIGGRPESVARAEQVMAHVCALDPAPDLLLVTGDIADHGLEAEYAAARDLLDRWSGPVLVGTGNHDRRDAFSRVLLGGEQQGPLNRGLFVGGHQVLMLDSLIPAAAGERVDPGELEPETLSWLDARLAQSHTPTFVCFHHPPTTVGIGAADEVRLRNGDDLEAILARHPHVVAVLVGHNHTMCATTLAGRPVLVGGGVVSSVTLDQEPMDHIWLEAPPSLAIHLVGDDGRLTTFWRVLPGH